MTKPSTTTRFEAMLRRPAKPKGARWAFVVLPEQASETLPTRGRTTVAGSIGEASFRIDAEPDGKGGHWLKFPPGLLDSAKVAAGDRVMLEIGPADEQLEPALPSDLRKAFAASPEAEAAFSDITTLARRDWVQWIRSAKQPSTRARRIASACDMLAAGKRRVCCFDRSGVYGGGFSAPEAAE